MMTNTTSMTTILVYKKAFYPCSLVVPLHMIRDELVHRTDYTSEFYHDEDYDGVDDDECGNDVDDNDKNAISDGCSTVVL